MSQDPPPPTVNDLGAAEKRALLEKLLREKAARGKTDLVAETELALDLSGRPVDPGIVENPQTVFLTGATGFVGAYALRELLDHTSARIYCLARAESTAAATERIRRNLDQYGVWGPDAEARLIPVAGDISKPRLGLSDGEFERLAAEVDVVYHIAAIVNLAFKYGLLAPTNVGGARNVLELVTRTRIKPLHYLSSYAIFDSLHNMDRTFAEDDLPNAAQGLSNGYCESKWVSEAIVRKARDLGVPTAIYRVGWVVGHSETGAWNKSDFIPRLIRACVDLGQACHLGSMTMTPVDFLAKGMVRLSLKPGSLGRVFHLSNGERYSSDQLFDWVKSFGYAVEKVSYEEWEAAMKASTQEISLAPMMLFLEEAAGSNVRLSDWFASEPKIDARRTLAELAEAGVPAPVLSGEQMRIYLDHFIASGYLPPATGSAP